MAVYEYNLSSINEYLEDCYGGLNADPDEGFDCGKISNDIQSADNYSLITCNETLIPFGNLKSISKNTKTKTKKVSGYFIKLSKITDKSIILNGLIINWIGYGTLFELDNGLDRLLVPDKSGGGV